MKIKYAPIIMGLILGLVMVAGTEISPRESNNLLILGIMATSVIIIFYLNYIYEAFKK